MFLPLMGLFAVREIAKNKYFPPYCFQYGSRSPYLFSALKGVDCTVQNEAS